MDKLITPFQNAFIQGRNITDNILITYEILDILRKKKGRKKGFGVLKVDICKARDGNGAGQCRRMGSSSPSCMVLSYPISPSPCMMGKTFSLHPHPLGPHEAQPHSVKLYFLLIYPTTSTIFLMKLISLIKIYLKLQLNLSHQIKSILGKIE